MACFIILPFLGGWIGYNYAPEKVVEIERIVEIEIPVESRVEETNVVNQIYTNKEYGFSFRLLGTWYQDDERSYSPSSFAVFRNLENPQLPDTDKASDSISFYIADSVDCTRVWNDTYENYEYSTGEWSKPQMGGISKFSCFEAGGAVIGVWAVAAEESSKESIDKILDSISVSVVEKITE